MVVTEYTLKKAKKLGVKVKPSTNPKKKLDVFSKDGVHLASVGAAGYADYPTYLSTQGKAVAEERRRLYRIRHAKDLAVVGSNGWWANELLW
jgi:hypothetical protein